MILLAVLLLLRFVLQRLVCLSDAAFLPKNDPKNTKRYIYGIAIVKMISYATWLAEVAVLAHLLKNGSNLGCVVSQTGQFFFKKVG